MCAQGILTNPLEELRFLAIYGRMWTVVVRTHARSGSFSSFFCNSSPLIDTHLRPPLGRRNGYQIKLAANDDSFHMKSLWEKGSPFARRATAAGGARYYKM